MTFTPVAFGRRGIRGLSNVIRRRAHVVPVEVEQTSSPVTSSHVIQNAEVTNHSHFESNQNISGNTYNIYNYGTTNSVEDYTAAYNDGYADCYDSCQ